MKHLLIAFALLLQAAPEKPDLWLYYPTNFLVDQNDETVVVENGVATVKDNGKVARFSYQFQLPKYRCYHVSVKVKTDGYSANPEIKALGDGRTLQEQHLGVKHTQDWTEHHVVFNTQ